VHSETPRRQGLAAACGIRRGDAGYWFILTAAVVCGGCIGSPRLEPAEGRVTLDGEPAGGVVVSLYPAEGSFEWAARGVTDGSGDFVLRSRSGASGAPAGRYKVTLSTERADIEGAETFSKEHSDPGSTILEATVMPGGTPLVIEAMTIKPSR
jgi:hypothetical protein